MPELSFETLQTFGKEVKAARSLKGMTLDQAGFACLGRDNAKGYFSQIENGKRQITPRTAGKIITALEMDKAFLQPFLGAGEIVEDEVTKIDNYAEKLIQKAQKDDSVAVTGDQLLIDLAYDFAEGQHTDLFTAYKGLRSALEAAQELKAQGNLPQNTSSHLDVVLCRVSELNEEGERDAAADFLEAEVERLSAQAEALFNAQLKQDRVRNRPDLAANRLYSTASRKAHEAGRQRFKAINDLAVGWRDAADNTGDMFALRVALELAKENYNAANNKQLTIALTTLGWSHFRLAERSSNEGHLKVALNAFSVVVNKLDQKKEPLDWSAAQGGLATTSILTGDRNGDVVVLKNAVSGCRAALIVEEKHNGPNLKNVWSTLGTALQKLAAQTLNPAIAEESVTSMISALSLEDKNTDLISWAESQMNLGLALRWLGAITGDRETLTEAREAYGECDDNDIHCESPMLMAMTQWNIADLALVRFNLDPDSAFIEEAREYVKRAREFFVEGSEYQTKRCDVLIAQIDAAEVVT